MRGGAASRPYRRVLSSHLGQAAIPQSILWPLQDLQVRHRCWWPFLQDKAVQHFALELGPSDLLALG